MKETRETFLAHLAKFLAPSEVRLVHLAYILVKEVHRSQVRQELDEDGKPQRYFNHLRRAALVAIQWLGIRDVVIICELFLHDIIEDHKFDPNFIEQFFGRDVIVGVLNVTHVDGESDQETAERLFACGDWRFITAKLCDRFDNIRSLGACPVAKRLRKIAETRELYLPGFRRLCDQVPAHLRPAYVRTVDELERMMNDLESAAVDETALERETPLE